MGACQSRSAEPAYPVGSRNGGNDTANHKDYNNDNDNHHDNNNNYNNYTAANPRDTTFARYSVYDEPYKHMTVSSRRLLARGFSNREISLQQPSSRKLSKHEQTLSLAADAKAAAMKRASIRVDPIDLEKDFDIPSHPKTHDELEFIESTLKGQFFYDALSDVEREALIGAMSEHQVDMGENIIEQGDIGDFLYILREGSVSFHVDGIKVGPSCNRCCFGELALLYDAPRTATCVAEERCTLFRVDQYTFRYIIAKNKRHQQAFVLEALQKVSFFSDVDQRTLSKLIDALTMMKFTKGHKIIEKGKHGEVFYIVQQGTVKIHDIGFGNSQYVDRIIGPGEHFGEDALSKHSQREANVTAETDCFVLCLSREDFERTLGSLQELLMLETRKRFLYSVPILADSNFSVEEMALLANSFTEAKYTAGDVLVKRGEKYGKKLGIFIVNEGSVAIISSNGTVRNMKKGDHFGDLTIKLNENDTSDYTITSVNELSVLGLSKESIISIIGSIDRLGKPQTFESQLDTSIKFNDIEKIKVIGRGSFGEIWMINNKKDGKNYALKQLSKKQFKSNYIIEAVIRERNITASLKHPFIVNLVTTFRDEENVYMMLGLLHGGSLFKRIHQKKKTDMNVKDSRFYAGTVLEALSYMHRLSICYRDLKPENILIDKDGYCVLVDMGFAKDCVDKTYTFCGTTEYMAPEILLNVGHNKGVDYWALGCLIYEMLEGKSPFIQRGMSQTTLIKRIINDKNITFNKISSESGKDLINKLLRKSPVQRLGCTIKGAIEIKNHLWFSSLNFEYLLVKKIKAPWKPKSEHERFPSQVSIED